MSPARAALGRHRAWALVLVAAVLAACGGPRLTGWEARPGPYDVLSDDELALLARGRAAQERGDLVGATELLVELLGRRPDNLFAATLLQDVELETLRTGGEIEAVDRALAASTLPDDGSPQVRLRRWYRLRAEGSERAFDLVLAARVEDDEVAALRLLDRAVELDRRCVWAHYCRAFVKLRMGDLEQCRASLERAIELDPGHPRVRRLEATLLERLGERDAARAALVEWTRRVADDPRVPDGDVVDANLDLARFDLVAGRPEEALLRLDALGTEDPERQARRALLTAGALSELGDYENSLASAREARLYRPGDYLSWMQEAIVLQEGLGDLAGALEAWRTAEELAEAEAASVGAAAFALLRVRVEIERLEARLEPVDVGLGLAP